MSASKKKIIFLAASLSFLSLILFWRTSADPAIYKYIDKNGTVHFTDRYDSIPQEYQNQIKIIQEEPSAQAPEQRLPETEGKEKGAPPARMQPSQGSEAERERKEAEVKAAQEQEAQDQKLQARQEKEKRIAELTQQISAKEEEIKSLRTTWMVYDRTNLYRLSGEIQALKKEVQSIQDALAAEK